MNIDLSKYQIRTDLVDEEDKLSFRSLESYEKKYGKNHITKVIVKKEDESILNKKQGIYYTIKTDAIINANMDELQELKETVKDVLKDIYRDISLNMNSSVLVCGLGNELITPDSLGPLSIKNVLVTRHLFKLNEPVCKENREISAIAPGVMGQTGIETSDIIRSITNEIKPDCVIVLDALAARKIDRINRTIQITTAGINPGSGVGNKRKELSKEVLGIPVIAIGVPTVLDVVNIVSDSLDSLLLALKDEMENKTSPLELVSKKRDLDKEPTSKEKREFLGSVGLLDEDEKRRLLYEVLEPNGLNLMVTPKEIDASIHHISEVLSKAINESLSNIWKSS